MKTIVSKAVPLLGTNLARPAPHRNRSAPEPTDIQYATGAHAYVDESEPSGDRDHTVYVLAAVIVAAAERERVREAVRLATPEREEAALVRSTPGVLESRGRAADDRDRSMFDALRRRGTGRDMRHEHVSGNAEPLVALPDIACGAHVAGLDSDLDPTVIRVS